MKLFKVVMFGFSLLCAFNLTAQEKYGDTIKNKNKLTDISKLKETMKTATSDQVVVQGKVKKVCKKKGCWMSLATDGTEVRVRFKDYSFFVPLKLEGSTVVASGKLYKKTESVADQKHYASDAGASKADIAKITKPKNIYEFIASGVEVVEKAG